MPPPHAHLTEESLRELLDEARSEAADRWLLHLLAVCPECRTVGGYLLDLAEQGAIRPPLGVVDIELARSRAAAPALLAELRALKPIERRRRVGRDRRFHSWGLAERLAEESARGAAQDAWEAMEPAGLAVTVARRIPPDDPAEAGWRDQLEAFTAAHLADARHRFGDLAGADAAFRRAERLWHEADSLGDVLGYRARMLELEASLRRAQRRLPEALALLDRALAADEAEASPGVRGRLLVAKSEILAEQGGCEPALALLAEAEPLAAAGTEPRLLLGFHLNRLEILARLGRFAEARAALPAVGELARVLGEALDGARLRWAEGKILGGLGQDEAALAAFDEARQAFAEQGHDLDAARVAVEAAMHHARAGRTAEVRALARAAAPDLGERAFTVPALAALALFRAAAEEERLTPGLAGEILRQLERERATSGPALPRPAGTRRSAAD